MSTLNEEILRLKNAKAAIDEVLIARGVTIPESATLDTYNELINSIQGGTSSEEVTATKANVLAGTTTITADSNDEIVEGTMPNNSGQAKGTDNVYFDDSYMHVTVKYPGYYDENSTIRINKGNLGDATADKVLDGTYFTSSDGLMLEGAMVNNGAVSQSLNAGGSYTIPAGYHDGTGKVTANSLASQTDGTATAAQILKDQTAYVDGVKVTGTMPNNGAVAPSALGAGGSYTIPAGYHNGSGKVTVQSLATLTASGDATAAQILSGKKAYVDGSLLTGTMTDQGAKTSSLNCGGSYTIPAGYHNGSGKITANSLASQTDATATSAYIRSGYTAWVKGSKLTGTMAVTSAINFNATALSTTSIRISWTNPSKGPWEGVEIRMSTSGNPGVSGGTQKYKGRGNSATAGGSNYVDITGLNVGTTYYFTCTSYATGLGNGASYNVSAKTSGIVLWDGSSLQNGATWKTSDMNLLYSFTEGFIEDKKLLLIPKVSLSNYYGWIRNRRDAVSTGGPHSKTVHWFDSAGFMYTANDGFSQTDAYSSWTAGKSTLVSLSKLKNPATTFGLEIQIRSGSSSKSFATNIQCLAII